MATNIRLNPFRGFNFEVRFIGLSIASFSEINGIAVDGDVVEYREGNDQPTNTTDGAFVRKQPGLERYPNVMLKRGITGSSALWDLRKNIRKATDGPAVAGAKPGPVNWTIELHDEAHKAVVIWTLTNAWISKLSGPSLNARGNEIAIESVEVVCERIEVG